MMVLIQFFQQLLLLLEVAGVVTVQEMEELVVQVVVLLEPVHHILIVEEPETLRPHLAYKDTLEVQLKVEVLIIQPEVAVELVRQRLRQYQIVVQVELVELVYKLT